MASQRFFIAYSEMVDRQKKKKMTQGWVVNGESPR
jgi:hypothetical protein